MVLGEKHGTNYLPYTIYQVSNSETFISKMKYG